MFEFFKIFANKTSIYKRYVLYLNILLDILKTTVTLFLH